MVLLHGAGSTRSAVLDHAAVLARTGYGVLLFDARGHGESHGRAMDFGWYGDRDVNGAVQFVAAAGRRRERAHPRGRACRWGVRRRSAPPRPTRGSAVWWRRARRVGPRPTAPGCLVRTGSGGSVQEALDRLRYGLVDLLTPTSPPPSLRHAVEAMAPRRVLLIAARRVHERAARGRPHRGRITADGRRVGRARCRAHERARSASVRVDRSRRPSSSTPPAADR